MNRLKKLYTTKYRGELQKDLGLKSVMAVPALQKIVINSGVGEATTNPDVLEETVEMIQLIAGQRPVVTKAKKAVATFKIRKGDSIGVMVILRGERMWNFFDKLVNVTLPRIKDFRGFSPKAFDGGGNYSFGIEDHVVFPEVDPNKVSKIRSLQITFVFSTKDNNSSKVFLDKFGFPFSKYGN